MRSTPPPRRPHQGTSDQNFPRTTGIPTRYSRSAVARAEATGVCSREFCRLAGQLYGTGEELALEHDRIEALALADRSQAARLARQRRHPPTRVPAPPEQNDVTFTALEAACPYCGKPVAVLTRQSTALLPLESPGPPP